MPHIDGRIECGQVAVELKCDSSELDAALVKMDRLIEKLHHAQTLGLNLGMLTPLLICGAVASPNVFSRRRLFSFGWRR